MLVAVERWLALNAGDRCRLLGLVLLLPIVSASLALLGYRRSRAIAENLSRTAAPRPASTVDVEQAESLAQLTAIAGRRGLVRATCLRQALAVYMLLRRRGLAPALKLGVDRVGSQPDMHAWVELDGHPLAQSDLRHRAFGRHQAGVATSANTQASTSSRAS